MSYEVPQDLLSLEAWDLLLSLLSLFSSSSIFCETSTTHGKLLNLFPYDHLRLKKYGLCLISSISSLEEVIGNLGFWIGTRS
jgi:hypothetical protein